jgi:cobalamin biosynthesis Mg chelatase CobN
MKKFLFLLLLVLVSSCHTAKLVTQQTATTTAQQHNDITATATQVAATNQTAVTQQSQAVKKTTVTTNYDTTKPIVEQTGRPPVAQETTEETLSWIDASGKVIVEANLQTSQMKYDKTTINKESKSTIVQKSTPVKSWVAYAWYILAVVLIIAIIFIVRHYWPKIKLLYGSVFHVNN